MADMDVEKKVLANASAPTADVAAGERVCVVIKDAGGSEVESIYDEAVPSAMKIVKTDLGVQISAKMTDV